MKTYSGSLGIVILPDPATCREVHHAADMWAPKDADYLVQEPHITLYHARLNDVSYGLAAHLVDRLKDLEGTPLPFWKREVYGGKFLFWDLKPIPRLGLAHDASLLLSRHLDRAAAARALEEGLTLTDEERRNVEAYGHPLVIEHYRPHVTIAYRAEGMSRDLDGLYQWHGHVKRVCFAEIGLFGRIENIIF